MDTSPLIHAAILAAVVFGSTELLKAMVPAIAVSRRLTVLAVLVISLGGVFLLSETVWAHAQVVAGKPLDELNIASKLVAGLMVAAFAAFTDRGFEMVKNVGQNQVQKPIAK